ncbi:MAG: hypothetical protein JNM51_08505 [Bacteroidia bacterium]|nr:hypothetical protein [Bacteroidia bacterium]
MDRFSAGAYDYGVDNFLLQALTPGIQAVGTTTICKGATAALTATANCGLSLANYNFAWTPTTGLSSPTTMNTNASPTVTTTYTLVATPTSTIGGLPSIISTVLVTVIPTFTVNPASQFIYAGQTATMTATGSTGTYSWMPGPLTGSLVTVTPTATTIYTVTNAASGTCSVINPTVVVSTACSQTAAASYSNFTVPSGTYTAAGTVVDLAGTITFTGSTSFTGYTMRMAPGTLLYVAAPGILTLDNCKLYGCTELWQGIQLEYNPRQGSIDVKNGTTIEDMYAGIYRLAATTNTSTQGIININNSKLNKNYVSVQLISVPGSTVSGTAYNLTVKNSTITTESSITSPGFSLKPSTIPSYTYAYNQIAGGASGGTTSYTAFPRGFIGINLYNLSTNHVVVIGDSAGSSNTFNTFSNLDIGIMATNAQLRVHNNYFYNLKGSTKQIYFNLANPTPTPIGPDEIGVGIVAQHTVANTYSLQVGTKTSAPVIASLAYPKSNAFKTINKGIYSKNCNLIIAKGNFFDADTTDEPSTDFFLPGATSPTYNYYKAQSAVWVSALGTGGSITNNYIKNYRAGIYASITLSVTSGSYLNVKSNTVLVNNVNGYCRNGINLEQVGGANMPASAIEVSVNNLNKVYNGINAKAILAGLYVHDNTSITLDNVKLLGKGSVPTTYSNFGITLSSVQNGRVEKNQNINGIGSITASNYSLTNAVYVITSTSNTITCNSANNVGRGFYFQGNCSSPNGWLGNSISNSYRGLELKTSGMIGTQGTTPSGTLAANTWSNVTQETFVSTTTNANTASNMFVEANGTYTTAPSLNFGTAGQIYINAPAAGIDIKTGTPFDCGGGGCGGCLMGAMSSGGSLSSGANNSNDAMYSNLVTANTNTFPQYPEENIFQNQLLVYKLQKQGQVAHNASNPNLQNFYVNNQNSNIGKFIDAQDALANNQRALAVSKNNNIAPVNTVQQKTKLVNELMFKLNNDPYYTYSNTELQDLFSMADECSVKGWYVTQSRNILNAISGYLRDYADNCEDGKSKSRMAGEDENATIIEPNRSFNLFPNPNNGSMIMFYDLGADKEAELNLYDVTGKLINNYVLQNGIGNLEINEAQLHNGIYFYRILVKGKIIHTNKVVIIK